MVMCYIRTYAVKPNYAIFAHTNLNGSASYRRMWREWIAAGLKKPGKDQYGLASALGVDRSAVSKLAKGLRNLKADEIGKAAAYLEEAPPSVEMPVRYRVGAGQECNLIDGDGPQEYIPVSGMWGIEAEIAIVSGDSMWPLLNEGAKIIFGVSRPPEPQDHNQLRIVRLNDDRVMVKVMRKTADASIWSLESTNAPPIEDVAVTAVAPILRIELA